MCGWRLRAEGEAGIYTYLWTLPHLQRLISGRSTGRVGAGLGEVSLRDILA